MSAHPPPSFDAMPCGIVERLRTAGCVFAEQEAELLREACSSRAELATLVQRRVAGLPLEHLLGWVWFCGRRLAVQPPVFVPRRRSEFLAERAAARTRPGAVVLELCCGAGAVGAAVAASVGDVELHAADLDAQAVACARGNIADIGGRVYQGDLYAPLPEQLRGRVEVLMVNAPYVPTGELELMPPEARLYERSMALDGGADGLDFHRRVAAEAGRWLAPDGTVLIETGRRQAEHTAEILAEAGLVAQVATDAERDATVVLASMAT